MTAFPTISAFTAHLARAAAAIPHAQRQGEEEAGHALAEAAKREIGTEAEGWAPLSEATLEGFEHPYGFRIPGKRELGFTGHVSATDPLLRTGALRASIGFQVSNRGLLIGSTALVGLWQEMGTNGMFPIPARPFLGNTMFRHGHAAAEHIAHHVVAALVGRAPPSRIEF